MPASITFASLSFALPDGRVLFSDLNLSLTLERTGIVGRNGAGKSTLLNLISGSLRPVSGSVTVTGTVGMVRQSFGPLQVETIASLFAVEPALARLRRIEAGAGTESDFAEADWTLEARLTETLARAGLQAVALETPIASLSGGQRTRASLAALIFAQPDFLLLDEPTNNLDREGTRRCGRAAGRLARRRRGGQS